MKPKDMNNVLLFVFISNSGSQSYPEVSDYSYVTEKPRAIRGFLLWENTHLFVNNAYLFNSIEKCRRS